MTKALSPFGRAADILDPPPPTLEQASPIAFAEARSRGQWRRAPHLELIEREVLHAIATDGRLIISVSFRHGKSEFLARWLIAWYIGRYRKRVILGTAEVDLAEAHGRAARDILTEHGADAFGVNVSRSSNAARRWDLEGTQDRAGFLGVGVGGTPTGRGGDLIVVDDPFRNYEDAMSPVVRKRVKDWWTGTMQSRLNGGRGAVVIICARWHEDDLSGFLLREAPDEWREIRLPAICDDPDNDLLGRQAGDPLWPDLYSLDALHRMRRAMSLEFGDSVWLAQAQQTPKTPTGGMFPAGKWVMISGDHELLEGRGRGDLNPWAHRNTSTMPAGVRWVRAWDLAATEGAGDWTVGALIGRLVDGRTVIADIRRGRWSADRVRAEIAQAARDDPAGTAVELPQDPGQAGKDQGQQLVRMLAGEDARAIPQTGSKETRALGLSAQQQSGNVLLVEAPWNGAFIAECTAFPKGSHDDQVDAAASGFNRLVAGAREVSEERYQDDRLRGRR